MANTFHCDMLTTMEHYVEREDFIDYCAHLTEDYTACFNDNVPRQIPMNDAALVWQRPNLKWIKVNADGWDVSTTAGGVPRN
ncbi:hypothetical protein V6N11_077713 [Hibiscus sabdariffa]|uniref:Uncharacterized protein n=1 Tax=Hibiscus sabdariffa TaxID=183260 RepID=A0ABR2TER9_9ROSI